MTATDNYWEQRTNWPLWRHKHNPIAIHKHGQTTSEALQGGITTCSCRGMLLRAVRNDEWIFEWSVATHIHPWPHPPLWLQVVVFFFSFLFLHLNREQTGADSCEKRVDRSNKCVTMATCVRSTLKSLQGLFIQSSRTWQHYDKRLCVWPPQECSEGLINISEQSLSEQSHSLKRSY